VETGALLLNRGLSIRTGRLRWLLLALGAAGLGLLATPAAAAAPQGAGAVSGIDPATHLQSWLIPSSVAGLLMHAELYLPQGKAPYPLAVINHGSEEDSAVRAHMEMPAFPSLTTWLLARGYAVLLPQRPGHGATGGRYIESAGWCGSPDFAGAGRQTAASIIAAVNFMLQQPFIRQKGVLVVGNSAGGWGALALGEAGTPPSVAGIINFAGGRGGRNENKPDNNCAPDKLVTAVAEFGRAETVPTLWLYSENDSFFAPALSRRMADAFAEAGGRAEYHLLPPVRGDGHSLIDTAGSEASWVPVLSHFLARLGKAR
jgi:dienelactone hydrolase